ncbi:hypothetical protein [Aestuariicoccus sp. MJ-SS9]|uniref:DUF7742 family protein n=1 Tax=Aestuariicoccus sp. MJ-SS9 TaxID=3079855 RepID=UPI00290E0F92|nr:hypothetical protein [Aestuariicoccus sp. MJ-SS9]MDU8911061.1 hypothetical protein [Aestuariicoccus sp. MJ-SS9]
MRPVLIGDVTAAACALLAVPPARRTALARRLIAEAEAARRYQDGTGRAHPDWGNGTLMSAALAHPRRPEPRAGEPDFLECLMLVLAALRDRRHRPDAQPTQRCSDGSSASRASAMSSPQSSQ